MGGGDLAGLQGEFLDDLEEVFFDHGLVEVRFGVNSRVAEGGAGVSLSEPWAFSPSRRSVWGGGGWGSEELGFEIRASAHTAGTAMPPSFVVRNRVCMGRWL